MKCAALLTSWIFLASVVSAQSVDGEWTTGLHGRGPDGQIITLTLKSEGSKITGTFHAFQPIPFEGTLEGNILKMTLKAGSVQLNYTAIVQGDEIKFTYQSENGRPPVFGPAAQEFTAKRIR